MHCTPCNCNPWSIWRIEEACALDQSKDSLTYTSSKMVKEQTTEVCS